MRKREIYKCDLCGSIVEVVNVGAGSLVCCNTEMKLFEEKTEDASTEKHVPFIERKDGKYIVKVGQNAVHPMDEKHYIQWIELEVDGMVHKKYLEPTDKPEVVFEIPEGKNVVAREYCNIHGVWKNTL